MTSVDSQRTELLGARNPAIVIRVLFVRVGGKVRTTWRVAVVVCVQKLCVEGWRGDPRVKPSDTLGSLGILTPTIVMLRQDN